jgi:UDP-3-O-[3-hydroxymyristoyl] glucosamine N-acyltransferase
MIIYKHPENMEKTQTKVNRFAKIMASRKNLTANTEHIIFRRYKALKNKAFFANYPKGQHPMDHDDLLKANQTTLNNLPETKNIAPDAQIGETSRVTGSVKIGAQTTIDNCIVRGPVIIGQNCQLKDTYVGPYTSLDDHVKIVSSEIENTIVHEGASLSHIENHIQDSIIGARTRIARTKTQPAIYQFRVGEDNFIEIV